MVNKEMLHAKKSALFHKTSFILLNNNKKVMDVQINISLFWTNPLIPLCWAQWEWRKVEQPNV